MRAWSAVPKFPSSRLALGGGVGGGAGGGCGPLEQQNAAAFLLRLVYFPYLFEKIRRKIRKIVARGSQGLRVRRSRHPTGTWVAPLQDLPLRTVLPPPPPQPHGDAKSKASRRLEEAFKWFGLRAVSARSGHGTRARASLPLPRSAGKVGVSASEGWPGVSQPAGGTGPLVPGVREVGLNSVRLPRRSRDRGFAACFVGVLLERFF